MYNLKQLYVVSQHRYQSRFFLRPFIRPMLSTFNKTTKPINWGSNRSWKDMMDQMCFSWMEKRSVKQLLLADTSVNTLVKKGLRCEVLNNSDISVVTKQLKNKRNWSNYIIGSDDNLAPGVWVNKKTSQCCFSWLYRGLTSVSFYLSCWWRGNKSICASFKTIIKSRSATVTQLRAKTSEQLKRCLWYMNKSGVFCGVMRQRTTKRDVRSERGRPDTHCVCRQRTYIHDCQSWISFCTIVRRSQINYTQKHILLF